MVRPFTVGDHKTHCQENTKEPRGQLFPVGDHKTHCQENTKELRGQPISSRCSQNTLLRKHNAQKSQVVSPFPAGDHKTHCQENTTHKRAKWSAHLQ